MTLLRSKFLRAFCQRWTTVLGCVLLITIVGMALLAPLIFPEDPWSMVTRPMLWPGEEARFPLGSDALGRDLAAGIFHGARISLSIGIAATLAALFLGIVAGAFAGYHGGKVDDILMRCTESFQTVPPFLLTIVIVTLLHPSLPTIILAISLVSWPPVARLVRVEFMTMRERDFVLACRSIGMSDVRIIFRQILPNTLSPVIVTASIMVASAILTESSLAFLGLGDPNVMSWGTMIGAGRDQLRTAWYLTAIPGVAILLTVLAINLIGEGLNDALNPRLRNR